MQQIKNKPAYSLLICLSFVTSTYLATRQRLGNLTGLSELDRDEGLVELEKLSLINKQNDQFSILSLVQQYIIATIADAPFEMVEKIITQIANEHGPTAVDAILLMEPFINSSQLTNLKDTVTGTTVDQLYYWADINDDMGVYYCTLALEKLGNQVSINGLKGMAEGYYWYMSYSQTDAISALARLGEIDYLIDLLVKETKQENHSVAPFLIETLEKFGEPENIPKIDNLISSITDEKTIAALKAVRERILEKRAS